MDVQNKMSFLSKRENSKLSTLRIHRGVDPFEHSNFRYINRKLNITVGMTDPVNNPDEWIEVQSYEDAERQAVLLAAGLEPDFEINLRSRRARDVLAGMSNRVNTLSTRGGAEHYVCNPVHENAIRALLKSNTKTKVIVNEHCPDDRIIAVFKHPLETTAVDGAFTYVYDPKTKKHWLCIFKGKPTDVTWNHYVSTATVVDYEEEDEEDE